MARPLPAFLESLANATRSPGPYPACEAASALHRRLTVIDLHADPLMWSRDLLKRNSYGHVDVPRLIEGGVALQVFSTVTQAPLGINIHWNATSAPDVITALAIACGWPRKTWSSRLERALHQARALEDACARSEGRLKRILTRGDLAAHVEKRAPGTTAALLSIEGAQCLEGRVENVDVLFAAGVRMIGLTHFQDNDLGGSASGQDKGGLTDFGRSVLRRMEDLGIIIDLAHSSPRLFDDVLAECRTPPLVSHTGACSACDNPRNLTDAQLKKLAAKGGLAGVGYWKTATGGRDAAAIARSIRIVAETAGIARVALGSDFDGAVPVPFDATGIPLVTQALLESGMAEADIAAAMGGNALRFLAERLPAA
ncbi:MAG: dipeptidase [Elusimicrobia bacterium]|nr:dipeptidase [Elusimicrobiota bacterium]